MKNKFLLIHLLTNQITYLLKLLNIVCNHLKRLSHNFGCKVKIYRAELGENGAYFTITK